MPVSGYNHKRVWQYVFLPEPITLLYREWDGHDREWEYDVVERLKRGEAAPHSISLSDFISDDYGTCEGGWETTEKRAKDADRSKSVFLNDEAIAQRLSERELKKKMYEELQEENRRKWEEEKPKREAMKAARIVEQEQIAIARAEALREYNELMEKRMQMELEIAKEWREAAPKPSDNKYPSDNRSLAKIKWDEYVKDMEKNNGGE
jgi:hypothetical protein